jgi:hypothetical protein
MAPRKPKPPAWSDLIVACLSEQAAIRFAFYLRDNGVDVTKRDGANVYVPWQGHPKFCTDLYEYAQRAGYAADATAASAMATRLREIERRSSS